MKKTILLALILVANASVFAQKEVVLKYNYKKGDTYAMELSFKQDMGVMGSTNMEMKAKVNVLERSKQAFKLSNKIGRIKANISQGGKMVNYDSNTKDSDLDEEGKKMKAQFASALKTTSYTTFDSNGKILDVTVEPSIPGVSQSSNQSLMIFSVFPKEAVKVGSSWTNEQDIQGMKLKMTYTVKQITNKSVITSISGNISIMGISGKITGNATFDRNTGNTDHMKMNTSVSMQGVSMKMGLTGTLKKIN